MRDRVHLHLDVHPETLRLLGKLLDHHPEQERLGYERTEFGAFVDWERLAEAPLSTTEVATVHIARGCAALEHAGELPPHLAAVVLQAVGAVASSGVTLSHGDDPSIRWGAVADHAAACFSRSRSQRDLLARLATESTGPYCVRVGADRLSAQSHRDEGGPSA